MNLKYVKIAAIVFAIIFIIGIIGGFFGVPALLENMIRKQKTLKPGTQTREMWMKTPFPLNFHVNVFNVTNPVDVAQGAKPILKEIGPYVFEEWKDKYNLVDNEIEDSITFKMRNTFIFRPDKSNGLTGDELLTMPHPLIQPISILVQRNQAAMSSIIADGLRAIFPLAINSPFIQAKFLDIFYRGIPVDCSSEIFGAKAICMQFQSGKIKGAIPFNSTHYMFSLLAAGNASDTIQFTVLRGLKNGHDVGRVIKFNDQTELDVWEIDEDAKPEQQHCNKYKGTDSTIFPAFMDQSDGLWAITPDICRSLGLQYQRPSSYNGIPTLRYTVDLGDLKVYYNIFILPTFLMLYHIPQHCDYYAKKNEKENQCFCDKPSPDGCSVKGTMNIQKCINAPMVVSMPHFYNGDMSLLENVIGMEPNETNHGIFVDYEIMSGTPMSIAKRLQFNLDVEPVEDIESLQNLTKLIMPLFWIEESVNLNQTYVKLLKNSIFLVLKINSMLKWSFSLIGLIGLFGCLYLYKTNSTVSPHLSTVKINSANLTVAVLTSRRNAFNTADAAPQPHHHNENGHY